MVRHVMTTANGPGRFMSVFSVKFEMYPATRRHSTTMLLK